MSQKSPRLKMIHQNSLIIQKKINKMLISLNRNQISIKKFKKIANQFIKATVMIMRRKKVQQMLIRLRNLLALPFKFPTFRIWEIQLEELLAAGIIGKQQLAMKQFQQKIIKKTRGMSFQVQNTHRIRISRNPNSRMFRNRVKIVKIDSHKRNTKKYFN